MQKSERRRGKGEREREEMKIKQTFRCSDDGGDAQNLGKAWPRVASAVAVVVVVAKVFCYAI